MYNQVRADEQQRPGNHLMRADRLIEPIIDVQQSQTENRFPGEEPVKTMSADSVQGRPGQPNQSGARKDENGYLEFEQRGNISYPFIL
jgi:hypothetical protein